ncbi:RHS repeat-associated core domain-containing protein [Streptomyces varsoviensis]|uniref:RHS repeat domain-containing protein n=1 Tax=Streptomyces varsoviensis TaxID=67373 RepID=UPI003408DC3C
MATTRRADTLTADGKPPDNGKPPDDEPPDDEPQENGPRSGDERATLPESLRRQRLTLAAKCASPDTEAMAGVARGGRLRLLFVADAHDLDVTDDAPHNQHGSGAGAMSLCDPARSANWDEAQATRGRTPRPTASRRRLGEYAELTQCWDATDRLTTQSITAQEGDVLQHRSYTYRPDGYVTEIRELTAGTRQFDLDRAGRVTGVQAQGWTETYAYDVTGNQSHADTPKHPTPGDREHSGTLIRRAGRTRYEHDTAGRLVRKTRRLLNGQTQVWTYEWNAEDRLVSVTNHRGERWHYAYDPLGRRISKSGPEADVLAFAWDGTRLTEQATPEGATTTWDYARATYRPLAQTTRNPLQKTPEFHAVVTDAVGTPTELIAAGGQLVWEARTTVWGTPLPAPPNSTDCPLRYPGQYADLESGLHYNYFRYYDPETARFLTPDPLGLVPAPHHHGYVHNPLTWMDPLGLQGCGIDDDTYDALDEKYGNRVADGVDHDVQRMNDGSPSAPAHSLSGIGSDAHKLAEYLSSYEGKMTHTDTKTGARVAYDSSRRDANGDGVLIVQTPYRIHAYHMPESSFNSGRYQSN